MKPYKLKHKPTGLYYQPIKHRGSNFSKMGKIYQTKTNILNLGYYSDGSPRKTIYIFAHSDNIVFKQTKDILIWEKSVGYNQYKTNTLVSDWEIEEI